MIENLIGKVVSELGVGEDQAKGGLGLIANFAKDKLSDGDFSAITDKIGGFDSLLGMAPKEDSSAGGGLGGMLGGALSAMGADKLAGLASLASSFKGLGLDADMLTKFVPIVTNFLGENGDDTIKNIISKVLK